MLHATHSYKKNIITIYMLHAISSYKTSIVGICLPKLSNLTPGILHHISFAMCGILSYHTNFCTIKYIQTQNKQVLKFTVVFHTILPWMSWHHFHEKHDVSAVCFSLSSDCSSYMSHRPHNLSWFWESQALLDDLMSLRFLTIHGQYQDFQPRVKLRAAPRHGGLLRSRQQSAWHG